jgi:hypothetical protein
MRTILNIGYVHFTLPASANVNAILAALNKAVRVEKHYDGKSARHYYTPATEKDVDISIEMVDDACVLDNPKKRKAIPEKASPDANNTF